MATNPIMKPCPRCDKTDMLGVYKYGGGWQHVECDRNGCHYLGPAAGSTREAIKRHNAGYTAARAALSQTGA